MHAFINETNQIITHLREAYTKIEAIHNPDMEGLKNKILLDLKKHFTALQLQLGHDPVKHIVTNHHTGPITKIMGKDVAAGVKKPSDVNKPFQQTVEDVELAQLRLKADELYPKFLATSSDQLLDSVSDIEIRAVAKKAGLPVTETNPARITTEYIDKIKAAIQAQNAPSDSDLNDPVLKELSRSKEELYNGFVATDNKEIIEIYSDTEIREVAKMAGLPFTKATPAKIDGKVLNQIKNAIKKKAELNALAGNV